MRRLATGREVPCAASNKTRSLIAMRPESGLVNPATQSSRVVLPAPDGPNRIVNPGAAWNSTSRTNSWDCAAKRLRNRASSRGAAADLSVRGGFISRLFYGPDHPCLAVEAIHHRQHDEAEREQQQRGLVGASVIGGLHAIEDINGHGSSDAGNISADHEHDAEFSHGVSKAQGGARNQAGNGERGDHADEGAQRGSAQGRRSRDQLAIHASERCGKRLHGERQTIKDGTNHQAAEGEGQGVAGEGDPPAAQRAAWSEHYENIESKDRRGKDNRQRHYSLYQKLPALAGDRNPVGDGQAKHQQDG